MLRRDYITVTHVPTGISVTVDDNYSRSLNKCRDKAMSILRSKLYVHNMGKNLNKDDITYDLPDNVQYPDELEDYKEEANK